MDSIEILPCAELLRRLKEVKAQMPSTGDCLNDISARRKLRLKEITLFLGIDDTTLLYRVLRGKVSISMELQKKLSQFFSMWDRGVIAKEIVNGKGTIIYPQPRSALPPETASKTMRIEITQDGVKLRL